MKVNAGQPGNTGSWHFCSLVAACWETLKVRAGGVSGQNKDVSHRHPHATFMTWGLSVSHLDYYLFLISHFSPKIYFYRSLYVNSRPTKPQVQQVGFIFRASA